MALRRPSGSCSSIQRFGRSGDVDQELDEIASVLLPTILKIPFTADQWRSVISRASDDCTSANYECPPRRKSAECPCPSMLRNMARGAVCFAPQELRRPPPPLYPPLEQNNALEPPFGLPVIWVRRLPPETRNMLRGMPCELFNELYGPRRCCGDVCRCRSIQAPNSRTSPQLASPRRRPSPIWKQRARSRSRSRARRRRRRRTSVCCRRPTKVECECKFGRPPPNPKYYAPKPPPRPSQLNAGPPSPSRAFSKREPLSVSSSLPAMASSVSKATEASSSSSSSTATAASSDSSSSSEAPAAPAPANDLFGAGGLFGGPAAPKGDKKDIDLFL